MSESNQEGYQTLGWVINQSEDGLFLVIADEPIQREIVEVYRGGMIISVISVHILFRI